MSAKQDRTQARTPTDLERRYAFGNVNKKLDSAMAIYNDARKIISEASTDLRNYVEAKLDELEEETDKKIAAELEGYVEDSDLEAYAKTTDLNAYAPKAALAGYATTGALADVEEDVTQNRLAIVETATIASNTATLAQSVADDVNNHFEFVDGGTRIKGGINAMLLPEGEDLDNVILPNMYLGGSPKSYNYGHCPVTEGTFSLTVESCGEEGQLRQVLTSCHKTASKVYERFYYSAAWGSWICVWDSARAGISEDTGWQPLTVESTFIVRNNDESLKPVYKVTGNVVTVCGVVSNIEQMTSTSSGVVFARGIPEAYRPKMDHHFVCQGSGMNRWQCSIKTDGTLVMSRYGITEQGTISANAWLPFSCTYQF